MSEDLSSHQQHLRLNAATAAGGPYLGEDGQAAASPALVKTRTYDFSVCRLMTQRTMAQETASSRNSYKILFGRRPVALREGASEQQSIAEMPDVVATMM